MLPAFLGSLGGLYFAYNQDNCNWQNWSQTSPVIAMLWGSVIIALIGIYSLSSVMFGIRFSNLTHRVIITNGPYRFSKHPAYLPKNLSWWLISIPLLTPGNDPIVILKSCMLLLLLNGIYFHEQK